MVTPKAHGQATLEFMEQLDELRDAASAASVALGELYAQVRKARSAGGKYRQLEIATGLSRGTLQNVIAGKSPKIGPTVFGVSDPWNGPWDHRTGESL